MGDSLRCGDPCGAWRLGRVKESIGHGGEDCKFDGLSTFHGELRGSLVSEMSWSGDNSPWRTWGLSLLLVPRNAVFSVRFRVRDEWSNENGEV